MQKIRSRLARIRTLRRAWRYIGQIRRGTSPVWFSMLLLRRKTRIAVTFNDKILHKMAYDRRPILTTLADKDAVRGYVVDRVGADILPTVYAVSSQPSTIDWDALPSQYVAKATHGSGCVIIVSDDAPVDARLPVDQPAWWSRYLIRPAAADRDSMTALTTKWMRLRYDARPGVLLEWCYRNVPPAVIVEELLQNDDGSIPCDYRFFVFDGVVRFIHVDSSETAHTRETFTPDWTLVDVATKYPRSDVPPERPETLERMLDIASTLGAGMDFVRVDLYSIGDRVIFGEMTNYPSGGRVIAQPRSFDELWGSYWTLPRGRLR